MMSEFTTTRTGMRWLVSEYCICSPFVTLLRAWVTSSQPSLLDSHSLRSGSSKGTVFGGGVRTYMHKYTYVHDCSGHMMSAELTTTRTGLRCLLSEYGFCSPFVTLFRAWFASSRLSLLDGHSLHSSSSKGTVFWGGVRT